MTNTDESTKGPFGIISGVVVAASGKGQGLDWFILLSFIPPLRCKFWFSKFNSAKSLTMPS